MNSDEMNTAVGQLKQEYPTCGISFGYVGNIYRQWGMDDRGWYIFTTGSSFPVPVSGNIFKEQKLEFQFDCNKFKLWLNKNNK